MTLRMTEEQYQAHKVRGAASLLPAKLNRSPLEVQLAWQMDASGLRYVSEYRFDAVRRWRLDFAFVEQKVGIEVEGGIWTNGRHNRGSGFEADAEKYNALASAGWRLFRFTPSMVKSGVALQAIQAAVK